MYTLDTSSLGAQLGSTSTDYVLLVISQRGADKVLSGKLKLGAGASAAAGPSGANAAAFNDPNVEHLVVFAVEGAVRRRFVRYRLAGSRQRRQQRALW